MWVALKTPKFPAGDDGGEDSPPAKRQQIARSASQDSDENGRTPLGITFGDASSASVQEKGSEIEISDSQDSFGNEENSARGNKEIRAKKSSAQDGDERDSPDHVSVSSDNTDNVAALTSLKDLQSRLALKYFTFNLRETKTIVRWMRLHRTYKISSHKAEFNELVQHLGYTNAALSQKDQNELRTKLRTKMSALHGNMMKSGAISDEYDGYDSSGSSIFRPLQFEEWTLMWLKNGWDGNIHKPDKATYEAIMNARDDGHSVSSDGGNGEDQEQVKQEGEQDNAQEDDLVPGEQQPEVSKTHHDNDYDGIEIFVVEEPSERVQNEDRPPPKENEFAEANGWNHYLLNKEIIDEHDWNYRVVTAQHLGIDLKDLAALYPDPFPGYEPPPREDSAPPATPTRSVAYPVPSTPSTPSPPPSKIARLIASRPDSDESISLEDTDSEDEDDLPKIKAIEYR